MWFVRLCYNICMSRHVTGNGLEGRRHGVWPSDFNIMCPWVLSSFAIPNIFCFNNSFFHFLPISCYQFSIFVKLGTREMAWKAKAAADGLQIFIWWGHESYLATLFPTYFDKTTLSSIFCRFLAVNSVFFPNLRHGKWSRRPRPRLMAFRFLYDGAMSLI